MKGQTVINNEDKPKGLELGPALYVESLMNPKEVKERCRKFSTSTQKELR